MPQLLDEALLVYVESSANANKFYRLRLHDDGSVHKLWGRVRDGAELTGQSQTEQGGRSRFDRIYAEKTRKGYTRVRVASTGPDSTPAAAAQDRLRQTATVSLAGGSTDPVVGTLMNRLIAANRHNLMASTGGMISVDDTGQARTALGAITADAVTEARDLLTRMETARDGSWRALLTEQYLRLVPHAIPVRAGSGWASGWLAERTTPARQRDLLDALDASARFMSAARADAQAGGAPDEDFFRYRVHRIAPEDGEYGMVMARFHSSKQAVHSRTYPMAPKYIYRLEDRRHGADVSATAERVRNIQHLWHGTSAANVLSILQRGLFVPPRTGSSIRIAGRMFGDGIYLSKSATKSLNYSTGFWGGDTAGSASTFMFLTRTAMGYEYRPEGQVSWNTFRRPAQDQAGKRYDSVNALPERIPALRNHEAVVEDPLQVNLQWLVEF